MCDSEILLEFILLRRRGYSDLKPRIAHTSQQFWDRCEGTHKRQVLALETLTSPLFQLLAVVALLVSGQEDRNELVSPLAYLASDLVEAHIVAELEQCLLPRQRLQIQRAQKTA